MPPTLAILWLPVVIGVTLLLAMGVAYPASLLGVWMPDIRNFVNSFVRVLFFVAPGLVPLSQVSGDAHDLLLINPLTGLFESYRDALLYGIRRAPSSCSIPRRFGLVSCWRVRAAVPRRAAPVREDRLGPCTGSVINERRRCELIGSASDSCSIATSAPSPRRWPACGGSGTETWGLHEIDFAIGPGEGVALIGASGSGKTTVLRLIAGVLSPDAGRLDVNGRVGSLLSTEAGLLGHLTGRENAALLGVLAGLSRRDSRAALEGIKRTTRLEDAFERPVLSYSEGMSARLGFAVADETDPTSCCSTRSTRRSITSTARSWPSVPRQILSRGGIVVAAGHDHPLLETFCDRALWMEGGSIVRDGPFEEVRSDYLSHAAP